MVAFVNNGVYTIQYTNIANTKGTISIPKETVITGTVDITLIGKSRLDYGQQLDENLLHLLENFASYQDPSPAVVGAIQPDLTQVESPLMQHPTGGQFWYNKGKNLGNSVDTTYAGLYVYDGALGVWRGLRNRGMVSANSGVIVHGQQIPLPAGISSYAQCSWFVSPQYVDEECNYIACLTDSNATVTALYRWTQDTVNYEGLANYIIIGMANSSANYAPLAPTPTTTPTPVLSATPTVTPTPTHTPPAGVTATPTVTPTVTPTTSIPPSNTPTPTVTRSVTPSMTRTPTPSPVVGWRYTMNAGFNNASPGINYVQYGYYKDASGQINFGSMTPVTLNGWPSIPGGHAILALECFQSNSVGPTLGFYCLGSTNGLFSKIVFTDKFGILRTFTTASGVNSGGFWTWSIPQILFNANTSYTIMIYP